ncbi:MAG: hypothetical protein AB7G15_10465 [Alphaproteobacteria bacterium]
MACGASNGATILSAPADKTPPNVTDLAALGATRARLDAFAEEWRKQSWFVSLGAVPADGELADARMLAELLDPAPKIEWIESFAAATQAIQGEDWSRAWWQREEELRQELTDAAQALLGAAVLDRTVHRVIAEATSVTIGPAAVAASRFGIGEQTPARVAAGAATQAALHAWLLLAADRWSDAHPFAARYRLFAGGRWVLGGIGDVLKIF